MGCRHFFFRSCSIGNLALHITPGSLSEPHRRPHPLVQYTPPSPPLRAARLIVRIGVGAGDHFCTRSARS
jgi:hypothetical protein